MSDTPETDKEVLKSVEAVVRFGIQGGEFAIEQQLVTANFARKLERERNEWRACAQKLSQYAKDYHDEWSWSHLDSGEEVIAKFERLKETNHES